MRSISEAFDRLASHGYAFLPNWKPDVSTDESAHLLGELVDVGSLLPGCHVPSIQTLRPREVSPDLDNQYSGTFGLGPFPLHTDLAHWQIPPRYLVLRCIVGSPSVSTTVLPVGKVAALVGEAILRRAVVRPRRRQQTGGMCLLPVRFSIGGVLGLRWDELFLEPVNGAGSELKSVMASHDWNSSGVISLKLTNPGDTLLLDNWQVLHGRSSVNISEKGRVIERAYLNCVGEKNERFS